MSRTLAVIRCRDAGRTLDAALAAAQAGAQHLVVVDDGSIDLFTRQRLGALAGTLRLDTASEGAAWNLGLAEGDQPFVLCVEADVAVHAAFLARALALLERDATLDAVLCPVRTPRAPNGRWLPPALTPAALLAAGVAPPAFVVRRALLRELGGFDEALPAGAALDFWLRAAERGVRTTTLDDAVAQHVATTGAHQAWTPVRSVPAEVLARHRAALGADVPEAVVAFEAAVRAAQEHSDALGVRTAALEADLARLDAELLVAREALARRGMSPLRWGDLGRTAPLSPLWALDRGKPVDRYYLERFLERHAADVQGDVLEVKDSGYTRWYGKDRVRRAEVLDVDAANEKATLVADLSARDALEEGRFDCFILTQTVHIIFGLEAALRNAVRCLKPGGTLLCTLPAVGRVNFENGGLDGGDYWRFTEAAVRALFASLLPPESVEISVFGNVKAATALLQGVAAEELSRAELDEVDPWHPVLFTVRARKPEVRKRASSHQPRAVLVYHRVADAPSRGAITSTLLGAHLELLSRKFGIAPLEALERQSTSSGQVAITFDDGTADALEKAAPLLGARGVPATFFVGTGTLDAAAEGWHDALEHAIWSTEDTAAPLRFELAGKSLVLSLRTPSERASAQRTLEEAFRCAPHEVRGAVLEKVRGRTPLAPRATHRLLTRDELRALAALPGIRVGSHGRHHLSLPAQTEAVGRDELTASRAELERVVGQPVEWLAYPYGEANDAVAAWARAAGYRLGFTVAAPAPAVLTDPLRIPRLEVGAWSVAHLESVLERLLG